VDKIIVAGWSVKEALDWVAEEIDKAIEKGEWE